MSIERFALVRPMAEPVPAIRLVSFRVALGVSLLIYFHAQWIEAPEWLTAMGFHASEEVLRLQSGAHHAIPLLNQSALPWFELFAYASLLALLWTQVQGHYRTDLAALLLQSLPLWAWTIMQVGALVFELSSPLIFIVRKFRPFALIFGVVFHILIAVLMHKLIYFSLQILSMYVLFVEVEQLQRGAGRLAEMRGYFSRCFAANDDAGKRPPRAKR